MQHRPIFGDVDFLTSEHGVPMGFHARLLGELDQQRERLVIGTVFGVVEIESGSLHSHALAASWIGGKEFPQSRSGNLVAVGFEGFPRRQLGEVGRVHGLCGSNRRHIQKNLTTSRTLRLLQ